MYGYNDFSYPFSGDFLEHSQLVPVPPLQVNCPVIPNNEFDSVPAILMMKQELCNYTTSTSRCSSYASPTTYEAQHSNDFQYHQQVTDQFSGYHDSTPVINIFNNGDLEAQYHHRSESPLSNESSIIECMNAKACKYSPEEKKEKIEKYRSKCNQRNFNKKIKYVCRKTLADSRPRIRGRFAKNSDENDKGGQLKLAADNHGYLEECNENWINFV